MSGVLVNITHGRVNSVNPCHGGVTQTVNHRMNRIPQIILQAVTPSIYPKPSIRSQFISLFLFRPQ